MGVATLKINKTVALSMLSNEGQGISPKDLAQILLALPKGSSVESFELLPIESISLDYCLRVSNPLFREGGVIDACYTRLMGFPFPIGGLLKNTMESVTTFMGLDLSKALLTPVEQAEAIEAFQNLIKKDEEEE